MQNGMYRQGMPIVQAYCASDSPLKPITVLYIRYPEMVWLLISVNALLFLLVAMFVDGPMKALFLAVSAIALLQALGFATACIKLDGDQLKLRHFFRSESISKASITKVDAANFRTVLVGLENGETKQLPAFGLDSFRTAKIIRRWVEV